MDTYAAKFSSMQLFVPFLDKTIGKLERAGDRSKEAQLGKMKSLHGILTDPQKKVRLEVLVKCEGVLRMLYEKVEGQPWPHGAEERGPRPSSTPRSPSPEQSSWRGPGPGPPRPPGPPATSRGWGGPWREGHGPKGGNNHDRGDKGRHGPSTMRDGPGPMRDGPGPMRDGPGPMRDGPGPMRDGPGPMRDGPGLMRDGPGPMRDGPGLMRDGPNGMQGGPQWNGPGPMREGPVWDRPGPGQIRDGSAWDGPGPMRHGPGPMREGPGNMRDGHWEGPRRDGPVWDGPMRDGPGPMRDGLGPMRDGPGPMRDGPNGIQGGPFWDGPRQGPPGRGPMQDGQWQGPGPWQEGHGPARGGHRGGHEGRQRGTYGRPDNYHPNQNLNDGRNFNQGYSDFPQEMAPQGRRPAGFPSDRGGRGSNPRGGSAWQQGPLGRGAGIPPGLQRDFDSDERNRRSGSRGSEERTGRWQGGQDEGKWRRSNSPREEEPPQTPQSPEPDTPMSPVQDTPLSPEMSSPPFPLPKVNPKLSAPKSIPLERPAEKPRLSEAEKMNKLLSLKSKLEGKPAREFSPGIPGLPLPSTMTPHSTQQPETKRLEPAPPPAQTPPRSQRPPWSSPTDSPPSLSIADCPMSPDTQTASPEQMPSPDTQSATPPPVTTSSSIPTTDTPASPDMGDPGSPEPEQLVILDTPSSPDTATSPSQGTKEIPTMPVKADSTKVEVVPPTSAPQPSSTSRRDPRNRNKESKPPTSSPYAPLAPPRPTQPLPATLIPTQEPPAYMSMVAPTVPPPQVRPALPAPSAPPSVRPPPSYAPPQPQLQTPPPVPHPSGSHPLRPPRPSHMQGTYPQPPQHPSRPIRPPPLGQHRAAQLMPSQPRTFKEYRKIKEEAEKQRREHQQALKKKQEERNKREELESRLHPGPAKEEENEELPVLTFDEEDDDVMTAKEMKAKRKEKLQKLSESKDPRKRKLLLSQEKEKPKKEERTAEVIKSFKIPKVKKSSNEDSKINKLSEIDIFTPMEIKSAAKVDLVQVKKKRKIEKFITKPIIEDSSSESDIPEPKAEDPKKSNSISDKNTKIEELINTPVEPEPVVAHSVPDADHDSDSDSEPSLTIAEEVERRMSRSSESETEPHKGGKMTECSAEIVFERESPKDEVEELEIKHAENIQKRPESDQHVSKPSTSGTTLPEHSASKIKRVSEPPKPDTEEPLQRYKDSNDHVSKPSTSGSILPKEKKDEQSLTTSELTKELLKNIVSTLDPKKAKKLLEKASKMNQVDQISLSDLRGLLSQDSSDSDDESLAKKATRKRGKGSQKSNRSSKKQKKLPQPMPEPELPTPGTRRSKRQIVKEEVDEEEERIEDPEKESTVDIAIEPSEDCPVQNVEDEEEETFVIEPRALRKRGKKKKDRESDIHFELDEEDLQDDYISSSGFIEQLNESKEPKEETVVIKPEADVTDPSEPQIDTSFNDEPLKLENDDIIHDVKLEPESVSPEGRTSREGRMSKEGRTSADGLSPTPPGMRQTRSMRSRMAPKSKTWFPGRSDDKSEKSIFAESALKSPKEEIKHEDEDLTPLDENIFLGEGIVKTESFPDNKFEVNPAVVEPDQMESLKSRQSFVFSVFNKVTKQSQEKVLAERLPPKVIEDIEKKEEPLCSKIKLQRPPKPLTIGDNHLPGRSVVLPSLISRLSCLVQISEEGEQEKEVDAPSPSFLGLIADLKKNTSCRRPPPGLIPLSEQAPSALTLQPEEEFRLAPTSACLTRAQLASQKSIEALEQLLLPSSLKHLFKCLLSSECSFTSDSAQEFLQHVHINHPDSGPPQCGYCSGRVRDVGRLVNHTIRQHGQAALQCCHCFHRSADHLSLLLHQLVLHPTLPRGHLACRSLAPTPPPTLRPSKDHPVHCPVLGCPHDFPPSAIHLLPAHLATHPGPHPTKTSNCSCAYCDFTSSSPAKVLLHLAFTHPLQVARMRLRQVELKNDPEENQSSSGEDEVSSYSDTESDLSDFDKHFYDEDIDTIDDLVKPLGEVEEGLTEHHLYKCGNLRCNASTSTASGLRDHLAFCDNKGADMDYSCYHCHSEHKHIPGLLEHIKTHAAKRLSCSLCSFRTNQMAILKQHGRADHKVTQLKFLPLKPTQNNPEEDRFVMVPKNTLPKGPRSRHVKDVFSPEDLISIPKKPDIYKYLIRCSVCDFSTKVKNNLVKHLKLHIRKDKLLSEGSLQEVSLPTLTPVNPPPILVRDEETGTDYKSVLPDDIDEEVHRLLISDEDMATMPAFIVENQRYACPTCAYITIDDVMLLDHISALHPKMKTFACPHCPGVKVPLDNVEFHLRCHSELLFKCGYCTFFHWLKREAERHVGGEHPTRKLFVKDVRANKEAKERHEAEKLKEAEEKAAEKINNIAKENLLVYHPFKCGLCDSACETVEEIRLHCKEQHEQLKQYKCSLCPFSSDIKKDIEEHGSLKHTTCLSSVLKIFSVDPSTGLGEEEKRNPLWSRDMEGVKHIRGILYEDDHKVERKKAVKTAVKHEKKEKKEDVPFFKEEMVPSIEKPDSIDEAISAVVSKDYGAVDAQRGSAASNKTELDFYPMQCKECGFSKKTVTGLKMHIKMNHLQVGKMQCRHCIFTANLKVAIHGHCRKKHPETIVQEEGVEKFDFIERSLEAQTFSQEYWQQTWGIPTLEERREALARDQKEGKEKSEDMKQYVEKKKKGKPGPKKGSKRKPRGLEEPDRKEIKMMAQSDTSMDLTDTIDPEPFLAAPSRPLVLQVEQSPFEARPSFMCGHCPKRSQQLDRIRLHEKQEHVGEEESWHELSRDQVVSIITSDQSQGVLHGSDYKCFYCQETGAVDKLQGHTIAAHAGQVFRIVRFQAQRVSGYLECQLCGHLSPGFEKHLQNTHFHDEHPLENEVNCSKYMSKKKTAGTEAFSSSQQAFKFDVNEVVGMAFICPRANLEEGSCSFTTKGLSQMNTHLRKHTKTFKCGWCGKTFLDGTKFHQHSAMSHGEKIPDLVKDPEAEAEYEALKGLLEHHILTQLKEGSDQGVKETRRIVARKSTGGDSRRGSMDKCRNVSRKSTGPRAKYWPETRADVPYSFYGHKPDKFDPKLIKTRMAMGGMEIILDAEKMMGLMNLAPRLALTDCRALAPQQDGLEVVETNETNEEELIDDLLKEDDDE